MSESDLVLWWSFVVLWSSFLVFLLWLRYGGR